MIIPISKSVKNIVKNSISMRTIKRMGLAAATVAMAAQLGLTAEETEAAKCALSDIAHEEGVRQARAIVLDMFDHPEDPEGGFIA